MATIPVPVHRHLALSKTNMILNKNSFKDSSWQFFFDRHILFEQSGFLNEFPDCLSSEKHRKSVYHFVCPLPLTIETHDVEKLKGEMDIVLSF